MAHARCVGHTARLSDVAYAGMQTLQCLCSGFTLLQLQSATREARSVPPVLAAIASGRHLLLDPWAMDRHERCPGSTLCFASYLQCALLQTASLVRSRRICLTAGLSLRSDCARLQRARTRWPRLPDPGSEALAAALALRSESALPVRLRTGAYTCRGLTGHEQVCSMMYERVTLRCQSRRTGACQGIDARVLRRRVVLQVPATSGQSSATAKD